jgi:hypothetical protein
VLNRGDSYRDTVALTVRADGVDIPPFLIKGQVGNASIASGRRPQKGQKPVKGMTTELMLRYAEHIHWYVKEPSLLILDRLSSHRAKKVISKLESYLTADGRQMFKVLLLPPKTAFLLSPLDNGVNSIFKKYFYTYDRSTYQLKKLAVLRAWNQVSTESVANFATACGLDGKRSLTTLRSQFEKNVKGIVPEKLLPSLELYDRWIARELDVDGANLHRGVELERPTQLEDSNMDGITWIEWGT